MTSSYAEFRSVRFVFAPANTRDDKREPTEFAAMDDTVCEDAFAVRCIQWGEGKSIFARSAYREASAVERNIRIGYMAHTIPDQILEKLFNQVYSFTTYRKFKGLDAAAVVLVDVGADAFCGNHAAMPFYEGASRARQKLAAFASMTDDDCAKVLRHFEEEKRYLPTAAKETGRDEFSQFLKLERRQQ